MICLDEMGPESAKSFPGQHLVRGDPDPTTGTVERAVQEIDYGRRGKGYVFGAFQPATGEAFTHADGGRTITNWVDFLERVETWVPPEVARVYAIVDNLNTHRATDVLLFMVSHPRPTSALNQKPVALMGAGGGSGTMRAQLAIRQVLAVNEAYVMPKPELYIMNAPQRFDVDGTLTDEAVRQSVRDIVAALVVWTRRLRAD